mmetsp:Transcript_54153/g.144271  ORF Transcript_54153/g.144271 Transcript_54153/m.144271 type:complete len:188 (+) Transcript_54153:395-958(+)
MIVEDQNKLVIKVFECLKQSKSFASEYRTNRMNFFSESYKLQQAVSKEKAGQVEQSEADGRLRELNPVRRETDITCQREIKELQAEFNRISYDFQLARKIADGTSCAKKTGKTNFMQSCMKIHQNGVKEGYMQFHESSQQHQLMTLMQTEYGRQAMKRGLMEIAGPQALLAPPSMLQVARSRRSVLK